jgi:hypothetical protein
MTLLLRGARFVDGIYIPASCDIRNRPATQRKRHWKGEPFRRVIPHNT